MSVALPAGNDPFIGGSKTPNAPPPALGGAIAPAQTSVGDPIQGVNAGAPFFARNNRGSNIGIPYLRYARAPGGPVPGGVCTCGGGGGTACGGVGGGRMI